MSDNSVKCQSAECEEYFDKLEQELKETQEKLKYYENGFKGACTTCENVGEINLKISEKLKIAVDALECISKNTCCDKCQEAKLVSLQALEKIGEG